jgi:hypothetical protein
VFKQLEIKRYLRGFSEVDENRKSLRDIEILSLLYFLFN